MRKTKEMQRGITLIALVITVIILLILAGISIMTLTNTGIFGKAQEAKEKTTEAEENQKATLNEYETQLNIYGEGLTASDIAKATNKNEIYGKSVEYTPAGVTTDVGWKIFYSDGENIYLIADNYVERETLPESTKDGVKTENKPNDGNHKRDAYFSNILNDYTGSANITNAKLQKLNNSFFSQGFTSTNTNMQSVAYMMDTTAWGIYKDSEGKADYVIGGPTIEMFINSYNQSHSMQYITKAISNVGYKISNDNGINWSYSVENALSTSDSLYVITSQRDALGMWVTSPSASSFDYVINVTCTGEIRTNRLSYTNLGFRPLVCLNSKAVLQEKNGIYTIH